jgi:GNAT superfamily N-acetyltransferase
VPGPDIVLLLARLAAVYLAVGLLFAAAFSARGARAVDPAARGAGWGFRLLIVPGAAAFWPLLALRWLRGTGVPPTERTSHKSAAPRTRP